MTDLLAAQRHSSNNRDEIEASKVCGCYYCTQIFSPDEIIAWTGLDVSSFDDPDSSAAGTALCPRCGSETVIGDKSGFAINVEFLHHMNEAWCQKTIIRKPSSKR